jgi:DNA-binding LytR/AlgR family response regulator
MTKIPVDCLLCITSDGSYSNFNLIDGTKPTFSFNLHTVEKILVAQLGLESEKFIRVGKSLIINRDFVFMIDIPKKEITLADDELRCKIILGASKDAVKGLKEIMEKYFNFKRIKI